MLQTIRKDFNTLLRSQPAFSLIVYALYRRRSSVANMMITYMCARGCSLWSESRND